MPRHTRTDEKEAFGRLLNIMDTLRQKCPWDSIQTPHSLCPNTIEEVYELTDAIERDNPDEIQKELGDVLMHVIFYAIFGREAGTFDLTDVIQGLCEKLIYRHPHIYNTAEAKTSEKVEDNWEKLKQHEKGGNKTVLGGVPHALPTLIKAYRIQDKARHVGFDWQQREQVWDKVKEEIGEFETEVAHMDADKAEAEFGDVLFSLINAARLYHINPDNALGRSNDKFIRRFNYIEAQTLKQGRNLSDMSLDEMDKLWNEAKQLEQ